MLSTLSRTILLLVFRLRCGKPAVRPPAVPRWKFIQRDKYLNQLKENIDSQKWVEVHDRVSIDDHIVKLTSCITSAAIASRHRGCNRPLDESRDWWNADLAELRAQLRKANKRLAKVPSLTNQNNKSLLKKEYQKQIRKARKKELKDYCSTHLNSNIFHNLKKLNGVQGEQLPNELVVNNKRITDKNEIMSHLFGNFFPETPALDRQHQLTQRQVEEFLTTLELADAPAITDREITITFESLNLQSAAGTDGIRLELIKQSLPVILPAIKTLYNSCLKISYFPKPWKCAKVCVLRKPGKESYKEPKSYRPISIPNSLGKVFEAIIHRRIQWFANVDSWISDSQHGFRSDRSTETAIHSLVEVIEENNKSNRVSVAAFIDITSAFDTAWAYAILSALIKKEAHLTS